MKRILFAATLCLGLSISSHAQNAPAQQPPDIQQILNLANQMMSGGTNRANLVDFRELKALLPAELPGMKRTSVNAERTGAVGMAVALAEAEYGDDAGAHVFISIKDLSGTGALGGMMQMGWANMEIDRETETGFERTTKVAGHPAMEKYDSETKDGEVQVFVAKKFHLEITGRGVPLETLKAAVQGIDLAKLAALKPKPKEEPAAEMPAPAAP